MAAVAADGCARQSEAPARPMNILYIMTDDHTAQMMSCYDTRYASTPNLDRIAAEGVRFTNSFVANSFERSQPRLYAYGQAFPQKRFLRQHDLRL